jgi:hypothetical protein
MKMAQKQRPSRVTHKGYHLESPIISIAIDMATYLPHGKGLEMCSAGISIGLAAYTLLYPEIQPDSYNRAYIFPVMYST